MKISARQYAESLYDSIDGQTDKEAAVILKNFVRLLGEKRDISKANAIIEAFGEIWDKNQGETAARLMTAREVKPATRTAVIDYLKNRTGFKEINLTEEIDHNLIGGFVLRYGSQVLDGSLKTSLGELKGKMSS